MHDTPSSPSDRDIIQRIIDDGDADAFAQILARYKDYVMAIVSRHVPYDHIEEIAHDAFIRGYQSLASFRGKENFKSWLASITVRTCYDFWRERYRSKEVSMSSLTEQHQQWLENAISDESDQAFGEQGARKEARELLDWALERLSAEDRMVLELVYLEGLSVKEAAELLGWTVANVKVRSLRSRRKLHKLLSELMEKGVNIQ